MSAPGGADAATSAPAGGALTSVGQGAAPLPARPLARWLLQELWQLPGLTREDWGNGWAAALQSMCLRPALVAVTGDGFGLTPPEGGPRNREPVVVVAQHLQQHLQTLLQSQQPTEVVGGYIGEKPVMVPTLPLQVQCVPAGTFKAGPYGIWHSAAKTVLAPAQRIGEWPDLVVQVGVGSRPPRRYPVPLVVAPVDWSHPSVAARRLAAECATALAEEKSVHLVVDMAAGSGFQSKALEQMIRRVHGH